MYTHKQNIDTGKMVSIPRKFEVKGLVIMAICIAYAMMQQEQTRYDYLIQFKE